MNRNPTSASGWSNRISNGLVTIFYIKRLIFADNSRHPKRWISYDFSEEIFTPKEKETS